MRKGFLKSYAESLVFALRAADLLALLAAAVVAYAIKFGDFDLPVHFRVAVLVGLIAAALAFSLADIYRPWRGVSLWTETREVLTAWLVVAALGAVATYLTKTGPMFSRVWFGLWVVLGAAALVAGRVALRIVLRWLRRRGHNLRHVVIVGAGRLGRELAARLHASPWAGFQVHAFFDDDPDLRGRTVAGVRVEGMLRELREWLQRNPVDQVWIALPLSDERRLRTALDQLADSPAEIRYVPDVFGFQFLNHSVDEVAGVPVLNLTGSPLVGVNGLLKALEDRLLALLVLLITSPVLLLIALGIRLTSPGPVLYRQERVTWSGRPFQMLKFRTMPVDAENASGPVWAREGEGRATRLGAFLRRTSLDELPQFVNVLRGEMSVVGPRPERPHFIEQFRGNVPGYMRKHLVKGGITGWAQVNGWRGNTSIERRIEHDLYYIENWSLWFDIKIILLTVLRGFVNKNAY